MEFLVDIELIWPPGGDPDLWVRLVAAETEAARDLAARGILKKLWRIPGTMKNVGIWQAANGTVLHEALSSLPFFPWLTITVRPLAAHPRDPQAGKPA